MRIIRITKFNDVENQIFIGKILWWHVHTHLQWNNAWLDIKVRHDVVPIGPMFQSLQ